LQNNTLLYGLAVLSYCICIKLYTSEHQTQSLARIYREALVPRTGVFT